MKNLGMFNYSKTQNLNKNIIKDKNRGEHAWQIILYINMYILLKFKFNFFFVRVKRICGATKHFFDK